jgi:hypothetical protein
MNNQSQQTSQEYNMINTILYNTNNLKMIIQLGQNAEDNWVTARASHHCRWKTNEITRQMWCTLVITILIGQKLNMEAMQHNMQIPAQVALPGST